MLGSIKEYKEASGVAPRDGCQLQVQHVALDECGDACKELIAMVKSERDPWVAQELAGKRRGARVHGYF